jgi:hypothetical protein
LMATNQPTGPEAGPEEPMVTDAFRRKVAEGMRRHWASDAGERHRHALSDGQSEETKRRKSEANTRRSPEAEALRRARIAETMRRYHAKRRAKGVK